MLRRRGSPCRILLDGVQSGIGRVIDVVDPAIDEGMDLGILDERECVVEEEGQGRLVQGRIIVLEEG